ncbi:MAG: hypothetical protein JWO85_3086 [Candidatus Eremiobacteraeota bacterium]|jgi:hypothetical protein|nr:hypothetical protein [Candidatus Eremiobacteraeota bacterium]
MAVVVLALALGAPRAANPSPGVADTVAKLNRDGFAAFGAVGAVVGADEPDVAVSPLLKWYVHRFLTLRSADAAARSLVQQLRGSGVVIETTMHVARGESEYTEPVAAHERDDLAAKTLWDLTSEPSAPGERGYAWSMEARMRTEDDLASKQFIGFAHLYAPYYARDGIRALRLDAVDGSRSLFLFSGTRSVLTDLRGRMSPALWQSLSTGFVQTEILLPDLSLDLHLRDDFPVDANESFGRPVLPTWQFASGGFLAFDTSASMAKMRVGLSAEVSAWGRVSQPVKPRDPKGLQTIGSIRPHVHLLGPILDERRFSIVAPLLYVVQDTRTGAILLMGEHV